MSAPSHLQTVTDLINLVEDIGFLPLFRNTVAGFSAEDLTPPSFWFDGSDHDPWQWRKEIAQTRRIAYGKFFNKKAGFISEAWFPHFANARRDGYDFDALYDDGKASHEQKRVMDLFLEKEAVSIPSHILKQQAGFAKKGEGSFEGTVSQLQMQTYLCICGFVQKRNKRNEPYGWAVSQYAMPETLFGFQTVKSCYGQEPADSFDAVAKQALRFYPSVSEAALRRFLK